MRADNPGGTRGLIKVATTQAVVTPTDGAPEPELGDHGKYQDTVPGISRLLTFSLSAENKEIL